MWLYTVEDCSTFVLESVNKVTLSCESSGYRFMKTSTFVSESVNEVAPFCESCGYRF